MKDHKIVDSDDSYIVGVPSIVGVWQGHSASLYRWQGGGVTYKDEYRGERGVLAGE